MEWLIHKDTGGQPIEKAKNEAFYYSFILTTKTRQPWFVFKIRRSLLDDKYVAINEEATLAQANTTNELKRFVSMAVKMQELGFRYSEKGKRYEITESQFQRFFV